MPVMTPFRIALFILLVAAGSIIGAWIFQALGYAPCELCLKERIPYYAGIALAALTVFLAAKGKTSLLPAAFAGLALIFAASAVFGVYHSGVEWGFWQGPSDCTGPLDHAASMGDFLTQLKTVKVVRCDAVAIRIFGLSLAGWNAVISAFLAALAVKALAVIVRR
ncbi:MAG: disulfide bond formation protein B [Methylocella sp.]